MKGFLLIFSERGIGSVAMERNVIWDTLLKTSIKLFYRAGPVCRVYYWGWRMK